jgi:hypothetical protein
MKKKKTVLLLLIVLLIIVTVLPACDVVKEGKESAAASLLEEMFPESTPTPTPLPSSTSSDKRVGMIFSDDYIGQICGLWPASHTDVEDFEYPYIIYMDNDLINDCSYLTYEFRPPLTLPEIQEYYGQKIFDLTIDGMSHSCKFVGETDAEGNPLDVTLNIQEAADGFKVDIRFGPNEPLRLVSDIFETYWQYDSLIDDLLTDDMLYFQGVSYDPSNDDSSMYYMWQAEKDLVQRVLDSCESKYSEFRDYKYIPGSIMSFINDADDNTEQSCTISADTLKDNCMSILSLVVRTRRIY